MPTMKIKIQLLMVSNISKVGSCEIDMYEVDNGI